MRELINERGQAVARYNKEIERFQILVDTDISNGLPDGGVAQGSKAPAAPRLPPKPEKPEKIDRAELTADQKAVIEAFEALVKADAAAVALAKKIEIIDAAFFDGRASAESYDAAIQAAFKTQATAGKEDERVKLADKWKDAIDPVRQYVKELEEVRRLVREGFLTKDQGLEAEFTIQLKIDDAAFGKLEKQVDKSKGLFDDLGEAVSSSLGQGVLAGERLGDTLRSLGQSLLSIGVREFLTKPFSEFLSTGLKSGDFLGMLAGLFGGSSGGGGGGGGFTGISLPGRASGGPVVAGKAYMVGEVGPELFVPKSNGTIVPNNRLSAGVGCRSCRTLPSPAVRLAARSWRPCRRPRNRPSARSMNPCAAVAPSRRGKYVDLGLPDQRALRAAGHGLEPAGQRLHVHLALFRRRADRRGPRRALGLLAHLRAAARRPAGRARGVLGIGARPGQSRGAVAPAAAGPSWNAARYADPGCCCGAVRDLCADHGGDRRDPAQGRHDRGGWLHGDGHRKRHRCVGDVDGAHHASAPGCTLDRRARDLGSPDCPVPVDLARNTRFVVGESFAWHGR